MSPASLGASFGRHGHGRGSARGKGPRASLCAVAPAVPWLLSLRVFGTVQLMPARGEIWAWGRAGCRLQSVYNKGIHCLLPLNRRHMHRTEKSAQNNHSRLLYYIALGRFYLFLPLQHDLLISLHVFPTGHSRARYAYFKNKKKTQTTNQQSKRFIALPMNN